MKARLGLVLTAAALMACGREPARPASSALTVVPVTGDGVGRVRPGMPADSVAAVARVLRDTLESDGEGGTVRVLWASVSSHPVRAEIVDERVWRLTVRDSGFATRDSIAVGTPLARLLRAKAVRGGAIGEGKTYVLAPEWCGLSFRLSPEATPPLRAGTDSTGLAALPPSTHVDAILVVGCARGAS